MSSLEKMDFKIYTDCRSLYRLCILLAHMTERRSQIDLVVIRQAYQRRDITGSIWTSGKTNRADGLTKVDRRSAGLQLLISTNHFMPQLESSVQRGHKQVQTTGKEYSSASNPFEKNVGGVLYDRDDISQFTLKHGFDYPF